MENQAPGACRVPSPSIPQLRCHRCSACQPMPPSPVEHPPSRGWQLSPPMPTSSHMTTKPTVLHRCILLRSGDPDHLPPAMELGTCNWCAQSRDPAGDWSGWSASRTVIIRQPIPIAPVLTLPANALVTLDTTPDFGWNAVPYGNTYEIQIDNLATFAVPIEQEATGLGLTYTATPLTDGLKYWRARAVNIHGEPGAWSLPRAVTIDTSSTTAAGVACQ